MDRKNLNWEDIRLFLAVLEYGSFSAAAQALKLGQATISRRIQNLETRFGAQLFTRGKYGAIPTQHAERLRQAAEQMAKWAGDFVNELNNENQSASGKVVIASPPGVAVEQLAPFAAHLKTKFPNIILEIRSSIEYIDLTRGIADLAIRSKKPTNPELVALYSRQLQPVVMASAQYANQLKPPITWQSLDWVCWGEKYQHLAPRPLLEKYITDFSPVFASDDYLSQKAAVSAGLGAMIMNKPIALEQSSLVEIPLDSTLPTTEIHLVCAKSMRSVPRVKAVADELIGLLN